MSMFDPRFGLLVLLAVAIVLSTIGTYLLLVGVWKLFEKKNNKEIVKMDLKLISAYVASASGQTEIADMAERVRVAVGSRELWKAAVLSCADEASHFGPKELSVLLGKFEEYASWMFPGHDIGHLRRDLLNALVVAADYPNLHPVERVVGIVAGALHDVGTALTPRYADKTNNAPHMSVSMWVFHNTAKEFFSESFMNLFDYAILAHGHLVSPLKSTFPAERTLEVYWDDLWLEDGFLFGAGIRITRLADRGDTHGLTQAFRHVWSRCDGSNEKPGFDLVDPYTWAAADGSALKAVMVPAMGKFEGVPTTWQHVTNYEASYRNVNFPYPAQDHVVPAFGKLAAFKFDQLHRVIAAIRDFNPTPLNLDEIKSVMVHVSGARPELIEKVWAVFLVEWESLSDEDRLTWGRIMLVAKVEYAKLLAYYIQVTADNDYSQLARETVAKLLMQ